MDFRFAGRTASCATLLTLMAAAVPAAQFFECAVTPKVWFGDAQTSIGSISFPAGSVFRNDLERAIGRWNSIRGMSFEFDPIVTSPANFGSGNGRNELVFATNARVDGALAVTRSIRHCFFGLVGMIAEADIEFNVSSNWETGFHDPTLVEGNPSFRFTAVHELGHFLGLDHEDNRMAVMMTTASAFWGEGGDVSHHPFPDDATGSRTLYSFSNDEADLAISNFRFVGSNATSLIVGGMQAVPRGGTFVTGFAFGNVGNTNIDTFNAVIVLSSNQIISSFDRVIANLTGFSTPGFYGDFTFTVGMPSNMPLGDFFVGAILDPQNAIAEERESNNRVVFPQRIRVTP